MKRQVTGFEEAFHGLALKSGHFEISRGAGEGE